MAGRILIIDDVATNRIVLKVRLTEARYEVFVAEDAATGIQLARSRLPDLVLLDGSPSRTGGVAALRQLRDDPATARIPVIAVTASAMPDDIAKGLEAGFFRYITKPIKVDAFMDTLDIALKRSQGL